MLTGKIHSIVLTVPTVSETLSEVVVSVTVAAVISGTDTVVTVLSDLLDDVLSGADDMFSDVTISSETQNSVKFTEDLRKR